MSTSSDALEPTERLSVDRVVRRDSRSLPPWSTVELTRVLAANALGLMLVFVSWYQVSGQVTVREQLSWFNVGIAGVALAVISDGIWLLRGRRNVGLARVMILPDLPRTSGSRRSGRLAEHLENRPVTAASMTRYHRPSCPLVTGKPVTTATRQAHRDAGKTPCELCEP